MTDIELDQAWSNKFGGSGEWASDKSKLDLSKLTDEQRQIVGRTVAYYHAPTSDTFMFYMSVLTVPNRAIMESILTQGEIHD